MYQDPAAVRLRSQMTQQIHIEFHREDRCKRSLVVFVWLLMVSTSMVFSQTESEFRNGLETIRKASGLPGLIAGHFAIDGLVDLEAVGVRRIDSEDPLRIDDPMHLGSCTKSMTATLLALLVDEGKLRWDETLKEIFSDDPVVVASEWGDTTVAELLHHTSGAVPNPPWTRFADPEIDVVELRRNLLHWLVKKRRDPKRVGQFEYSNLGYAIAGHVIEKIRGVAWEAEMQKRLFEPLGMTRVGFGAPSKSLGEDVPWGHQNVFGIKRPTEEDNVPALGPAGTVYASMPDWIKYLRFHLQLARRQRTHSSDADTAADPAAAIPIPIRHESIAFLHTPAEGQTYAGGWICSERSWAGGKIMTHNGSNTSWYCVVFLAPEQGRGIIAASNYGLAAAQPCDEALQLVLRLHPATETGK